ncbi:hypothetical protein HAX54_034967, partial [Datura stramonium]|nr:hypothetical protein [Datura stramonium]
GPLVEELCKANEGWLREFYANFPIVNWSIWVTYIWRVSLSISVAPINEIMGFPNPLEVDLKASDVEGNACWSTQGERRYHTNVTVDPLRVKGALERGRKKRKVDSDKKGSRV